VSLGGGRTSAEQSINPAVGLDRLLPLGAHVEKEQPIARVHAVNEASAEAAEAAVLGAYTIGDHPPAAGALVERIG
jgi:thymidine phosphorylase